jgi:hypothetical protein
MLGGEQLEFGGKFTSGKRLTAKAAKVGNSGRY